MHAITQIIGEGGDHKRQTGQRVAVRLQVKGIGRRTIGRTPALSVTHSVAAVL